MLNTHFKRIALSATALVAALSMTAIAQAQGNQAYEVSITNLTQAQIISPAVVASHVRDADPLFVLGEAASPELAKVAEDAMLDDLIAALSSSPDVLDIQTLFGAGGPIMPGETASVVINGFGKYRYVSLAAMLVSTNDAFIGVNGLRVHPVAHIVRMVPAYDAGSEANTEMCTDIPGPPCGNGGVRVTEGAEGYIYIHPGLSGKAGDAGPDANVYDWRNPVARISIQLKK